MVLTVLMTLDKQHCSLYSARTVPVQVSALHVLADAT